MTGPLIHEYIHYIPPRFRLAGIQYEFWRDYDEHPPLHTWKPIGKW